MKSMVVKYVSTRPSLIAFVDSLGQIKNVFSSALTISCADGLSGIGIDNVHAVLDVLNDWRSVTRITEAKKSGLA